MLYELSYEYSFVMWSRSLSEAQTPPLSPASRQVLEMVKIRCDPAPMTESEFDAMRDQLFKLGWELMEIERRPFVERETVT